MNEPNWINDLIKCPSQCYCSFWSEDNHYCIYLRWRYDDPWSAEIVELDEENDFTRNDWFNLKPSFYTHDEYEKLQDECVQKVKSIFENIEFDNRTIIA